MNIINRLQPAIVRLVSAAIGVGVLFDIVDVSAEQLAGIVLFVEALFQSLSLVVYKQELAKLAEG